MRLTFVLLTLVAGVILAPCALGASKPKSVKDVGINKWDRRSRYKVAQQMTRPLTAEEIQNLQPRGDGPATGTISQPPDAGTINLSPIQGQIVGGKVAKKGSFPYQVGLRLDGSGFCGGSLIAEKWVLTAAHCVVNVNEFTVYLGTFNINAKKEATRQTFTVASSKATKHADYNDVTLANDIAVIELPQNATLGKNVQVVKLPKLSQNSTTFEAEKAYVSGWGYTSNKATKISPNLQYTVLTVISNTKCAEAYAGETISSSMICVSAGSGSNKKSNICSGDSGGPLVLVGSDGKAFIIGIVSFGSDKCTDASPSGFTRVTSFFAWISNNTGIAIQA